MSTQFINKNNGLMFLSMGVVSLFLFVFLSANTKLDTKTQAHDSEDVSGVLISDIKHVFPCNMSAKADYVLRDLKLMDTCTPLVANKNVADMYLGQEVGVSGGLVKGVFYATAFNKRKPAKTPNIYFGPKATPISIDDPFN